MSNLEKYISLLQSHDWYYDHSDDHSVWKEGSSQRSEILSLQKEVDTDWKIWNQYFKGGYL